MDFETALKRLQEISQKLENGNLSLDESVKLYEEGSKLSVFCYEKLKNAQQKVEEITNRKLESENMEI